MAIGTVDGQVYLADWERNQQLGHATLPPLVPGAGGLQGDEGGINVLAVAWLRRDPTRFVAAAAHGGAALFSVDLARTTAHLEEEACEALEADGSRPWGSSSRAPAAAATSSSSPAADPNALSLVHRFNAPLAPKLTSMHCNSDDTLLSGSGYTHSVFISDLATGFKLRTLKNIHEGHVNIARFANQMPYLLLTSSFDHTCKMFDLRSNHTVRKGDVDVPVPIYTCSSRSGNVMVCFSPNDTYFLSSAVDNEVRQYHVRDGSMHLEYDIPKHNLQTNYTRSYYANEGECIISGASNSDLLYVASSVDGSIIDTVDMVEGRREKHLYIQSLRGCPLPNSGHNRCTVLLYFRANTMRPYELVEVNLNRDPAGHARELPMSLGSIRTLSDDYRRFLNTDSFADVVISCGGATGDQLIYAHQAVLRARWRWFAKHAQWSAEATQALKDAQAAAASPAAPAAAAATSTAAASSCGSLDDDDDLPMAAAAPSPAVSASAPAPLVFCRIQVPHLSLDDPVAGGSSSSSAASAAAPSFDTITMSSSGMVSIDFPLLSREHCLRLLEYVYTGSVALETGSSDPAKEAEAKAKATKETAFSSSSSSSSASSAAAAAASVVKKLAAAAPAASAASFGGLDDEEDEVQRAIAASLAPTAVVRQASATEQPPLIHDLQSALVAMSLRAPHSADAPVPVRTPFSLPPLPPSFTEQLALFILTLPAHYDLPRLANILERSIRRLLTLATNEGKPKEAAKCAAASAAAAPSSSVAAAPPTSPLSSSDFSALDTFASQLRSCVQYDARGVVQCAQDLILRSCDWLRFKHPRFLAQLPLIFPPERSNFVAEVQRALNPPDATRQPYPWHVFSPALVVVQTSDANSMAIAFGGFNPRISISQTEVQAINPSTLAVTPLACSAENDKCMPDPGNMSPTSMCAQQSADGSTMRLYALSVLENSLLSLDLNTLHWRSHKLHGSETRLRSKNSMTAVPFRDRIYLFGGRDRHNVFAELAYLERESASGEWAAHTVLDLASNPGASNATQPVPRYGHCAVYSKDAGGLVLFGGWGVTGVRNDVWLLNPLTNAWTRKCDNDRSMILPEQEADEYETRVASGQFKETVPLPRCHSSASIVTLDGREHMAVFGGLTPFQANQLVGRDLWLLDLTSFQWRKMPIANTFPPRPMPPGSANSSAFQLHAEAWQRSIGEWEKHIKPAKRYQHTSFVGGTAAASAAASSSAASARSDQKLCILGGSNGLDGGISWIDVYDFSTHMWSREESHLAGVSSLEPLINITDSGCLWQDMQRRFQATQPMAFSQPTIEAAGSASADAASSSSSAASSSGLDACIRFNLAHEQALFHHPSPLPAGSFIHFLCEGRVLTVPKLILVSRCSTFLTAITSSMRDESLAKDGLIPIEGVRYVVFRCILYFLYCGDIEFDVQVAPPTNSSPASSKHSSRSASATNSARGSKRQASDDAGTSIGSGSLDDDEEESALPLSSLHMDERSGGELISSMQQQPNGSNGSKKTRHAKAHDEDESKSATMHPSIVEHSLDTAAIHEAAAAASSSSSSSPSTLRVDPLELLVAADRFNLSSLCSVLEIGLSRQLDVPQACLFAKVADTFQLHMLRERCVIFIAQNFEEIQRSYSADYLALSSATRDCIEKTLHALAGSHRGLTARNEVNPLVLPAALASTPPLITPAGQDQPANMLAVAADHLMQMMAGAEDEDGGSIFGDDDDDEEDEDEDGEDYEDEDDEEEDAPI